MTQAQTLSERAEVVLLTCSPGEELYARYGHTAIQVCDPELGLDWTFNYGLFDFDTEGFYLKFVQGYTYYLLGAEQSWRFYRAYAADGRTINKQVLRLTNEQKNAIWQALLENYEPENRTYLYNFVFDNCATRPFRLIQQALGDSLVSSYEGWKGRSYRNFIRHYTGEWSWADFGINLLFGPKADQAMTDEERLFLPEELMHWMSKTGYVETEKTEAFEIKGIHWWETWPFGLAVAAWMVALLSAFCSKRKVLKGLDITMAVVYGLVLLTVAYLTWGSLHPLVGFGWRLIIVPLVYATARLGGKMIKKFV